MCSVSVEILCFYCASAAKYSLYGTPVYSAQYVTTLIITVENTPLQMGVQLKRPENVCYR